MIAKNEENAFIIIMFGFFAYLLVRYA